MFSMSLPMTLSDRVDYFQVPTENYPSTDMSAVAAHVIRTDWKSLCGTIVGDLEQLLMDIYSFSIKLYTNKTSHRA